jgi:uncharacterized protein YndB with AHSA1/START domain
MEKNIVMENKMIVRNTVPIKAPVAKVWEALTRAEWTKQYMYNCEVDSDWKPGSPVIWKMMHEGKEFIPVKGKVVTIEPGRRLVYTVIDPNAGMEDIPANYLQVQYELIDMGEETLLEVTQDGYEHAANGEKRYQEAVEGGGWASILARIKELLEG